MFKVIFKSLESSTILSEVITERIGLIFEKFSSLKDHRVTATVFMDNSPIKRGPDLFGVKLAINGKKYKKIILLKTGKNFYEALTGLQEALLERLNRYNDKLRIKNLKALKKQKRHSMKDLNYAL